MEIDLADPRPKATGLPLLGRLEKATATREVVEVDDLGKLAVGTLHALSARRFRQVDRWEVEPATALSFPKPNTDGRGGESLGHFLKALEAESGAPLSTARTFSVRVSDLAGNHAEVVVRRIHRERNHALSIDLYGVWNKSAINDLKQSLGDRLPVAQTTLTKFTYA